MMFFKSILTLLQLLTFFTMSYVKIVCFTVKNPTLVICIYSQRGKFGVSKFNFISTGEKFYVTNSTSFQLAKILVFKFNFSSTWVSFYFTLNFSSTKEKKVFEFTFYSTRYAIFNFISTVE